MKKFTLILAIAMLLVSVTAAFAAVYGTSDRGIVPDYIPGNFVASDDNQVCYELSALGYISDVTGEMRGVKIDPPTNIFDPFLINIYDNGKKLSWSTEAYPDITVLAFVIKGGPGFNVYDYVGTGFKYDSGLVSPLQKGKTPQISHYNFCYELDPGDGTGCTPGYWRNHADRWLGAAPGDDFDTTFGVDLFSPNITLGMAINNPQTYGTFAFHAVAALLNSYGGVPNADGTTVDYEFTTAEVLAMVQAAVAAGNTQGPIQDLVDANESGCPLSGTKAVKVP